MKRPNNAEADAALKTRDGRHSGERHRVRTPAVFWNWNGLARAEDRWEKITFQSIIQFYVFPAVRASSFLSAFSFLLVFTIQKKGLLIIDFSPESDLVQRRKRGIQKRNK